MSCLFLVFPSVWVYTVSPGVLLCSLAERMNGLPPPLPFIWLFEGCGCHWALQPLHWEFWAIQPSALVGLGDGTEMSISQQCLKVFLGLLAHLEHSTRPQVAAFPSALWIWALCWFCRLGQWVQEEPFLSSYPSSSVINPWGVSWLGQPLCSKAGRSTGARATPLVLHGAFIPFFPKCILCVASLWCCRLDMLIFGPFSDGLRAGPEEKKRKESVISCLGVLGVSSAFEVVCVKRCHYQSFVSSCFHQVTFCCGADFDTQHFLQILGTFFVLTAELTSGEL